MSNAPNKRPTPQVIRVPRPEGLQFRPTVPLVLAIAIFVVGLLLTCLGALLGRELLCAAGALFVLSFSLLIVLPIHAGRCRSRHAAYIARLRDWGYSVVAVELAERWTHSHPPIADDTIMEVLAGMESDGPPAARIVCLGVVDVPKVGERQFEPLIITPSQRVHWAGGLLKVFLALLVWWLVERSQLFTTPILPTPNAGLVFLVLAGVLATVFWAWQCLVRPTYVRLAPGMVQLLEYRYRRTEPIVRSYPIDSGTTVIVRGDAAGLLGRRISVSLRCGQHQDRFHQPVTDETRELERHIWYALLSTAPTPPLSDEHLVG
ncbi:MAG: hypothetical protein KKB50_22000 [Planctomycetes bacterium]|nr:hypothetical protein [Planctomycetota bacterium]